MSRTSVVLVAALLSAGLACGDADGQGGSGGAGGATTSGSAASAKSTGSSQGGGPPAGACIQPGEQGNANGVGEYCTPGGGQCQDNPLAPLCLADVGQDQWFCTRIGCDEMTDCGPDAGCLIVSGEGSACLPCKCEPSAFGCGGSTSASASSATTTGGG